MIKIAFFYYLLGVAICGLVHSSFCLNKSYYDYMMEEMEKAEESIPEAKFISINHDQVLNMSIFVTSLLSYIGLISVISSYIEFLMKKK